MDKLIILALLILTLSACAPATPTPQPTQSLDVNVIIAQAISEIARDATTADMNEAHPSPTPPPTPVPSETERIVRTAAWPASLSLMCLVSAGALFTLALMWNSREQRKDNLERQRIAAQVAQAPIADLKAVIESLREYQQAADVSPRNNEDKKDE